MGSHFFRLASILPLLACISTVGCKTLFHPKYTAEETEILHFQVEGISLGSQPSKLGKFPQIQALSGQPEGTVVFQVFNPNPEISAAIFTYEKKHLKQVELRYFLAPGVATLEISGGWKGILDYIEQRYGPPSTSGPGSRVVATLPGLDPAKANFNGEWIFFRVNRQFNYIAQVEGQQGMAAINIQDTTPPKVKKQKKQKLPSPKKEPPHPFPGFQ